MTTLTWRGNIVEHNYLFTSHENSWYEKSVWDEEDAMDYRLELDDIKEECQEIVVRWKTSGGSKNFDVHVRVKDKKDVDWIPDRDMKP